MKGIFREIARRLESGLPLVLATIIDSQGSTPRTAGSRMIIDPDGSIWGTIGGGRLEAEVMAKARSMFAGEAVHLLPFDLGNGPGTQDLDMICGGRVTVLLERLAPETGARRWWAQANDLITAGGRATAVSELPVASASAIGLTRHVVEISGPLPATIPAELQDHLKATGGKNRSLRIAAVGDRRFLIEPIVDRGTVFLFGAGHVSQQVAALLAPLEFACVVLDDRAEFANIRRFPTADEVIVPASFETCMAGLPVGPSSFLVILTRGHHHDETVLAQALATRAGYIGMIGSRRKRDTIYAHLREQGVAQAALDRVHCPIGLAIGAETPAEIAVSIVAELVAERAKKQVNGDG